MLAEFLIDNGIDVNSRDENGLSPIFLPIYSSLDMIGTVFNGILLFDWTENYIILV